MNNQEVAEWMLELAEWFEGIAGSTGQTCTNELNMKRAKMWRDRAEQVIASTCDGCRWWGTKQSDLSLMPKGYRYCYSLSVPLNVAPADFGCIHREAKLVNTNPTLPACTTCEFNTKPAPKVTQS